MSAQDYSDVVSGTAFTIPTAAGSGIQGPFTLYQLTQGQTARVEAVSFRAVVAGTLNEPVSFVLQLRDPSNNVLWQYLTPQFLDLS